MLRIGFRSARPRGFSYQPRFYDPKAEAARRRTIRIERPAGRRKTRQPAFIAVGLLLVLALYLYLNMDRIIERMAAFGGLFFG
ncbi:MAG: hypothetical protein ACK41D_07845 [Rubricoccaceae bacterium]